MPAGQRRFFVNRIVDLDSALIHEPVLAGSDWLIPALTAPAIGGFLFFAACLAVSLSLSLFLMDVCKLLTPSELQLKLESDANPQGSTTASPLHAYTCKQTCK